MENLSGTLHGQPWQVSSHPASDGTTVYPQCLKPNVVLATCGRLSPRMVVTSSSHPNMNIAALPFPLNMSCDLLQPAECRSDAEPVLVLALERHGSVHFSSLVLSYHAVRL